MKSEKREAYVAPPLTKIAANCFKEEEKQKQEEELKQSERLNSNKKRDKYWLLVRDLHPPQVSEVKVRVASKLF